MFVSGKCLYKRLKYFKHVKNFNEFYVLGKKGDGCALMHVYALEHIVSLYYRTT